ncbi:hypothetical protein BH09MYX1_BH09MYX1_60010 [soil metagenome]
MSPYALHRWAPLALALALVSLSGCTAIAINSGDPDPTPYSGIDGGAASDAGNYVPEGGNADAGSTLIGISPLCTSPLATCKPDDTKLVSLAASCGLPPPSSDAGDAGDSGYGDRLACRVVYDESNNKSAPQCVTAGDGKDGDPCAKGDDCKVGYECVGTSGRCRHYCCAPSECDALTQTNPGKTYFCDVQPEASAAVKVPVCLVAQPCELLKDKCGTGMTCALVDTTNGTTSCVAAGPAQVGQDCEKTHCAANLACLGAIGARVCERLCDANHTCSGTDTCQYKFPALKTQGVGICQ